MGKPLTLKKEDLYTIPVPQRTETYVPISNESLISTVNEKLSDYGYKVTKENYQVAAKGSIMIAKYSVHTESDEIGMMLAFGNSYNKSRRVSLAAGGEVFICSNGMIKGDYVQLHKHVGNIDVNLEALVEGAVLTMKTKHNELLQDSKILKEYRFADREELAALIGRMYLNQNFLTSTQLNIVKRQIRFSDHFRMVNPEELTAWNLYNNITESLKIAHPANYIYSHKVLHDTLLGYVSPGRGEVLDLEAELLAEEFVEDEA